MGSKSLEALVFLTGSVFRLSIKSGASLVRVVRPNLAKHKEDLMLEKYFSAPKTLARLRAGLSGPHIDGFADALERERYSHGAALRYLRAAAHLGQFQRRRGATLADICDVVVVRYRTAAKGITMYFSARSVFTPIWSRRASSNTISP